MTVHSESRSPVYFDSASLVANTVPRKVVKPVKTSLFSNGSIPSPISQFDVHHQRQPSAGETAALTTQPLATSYKSDNKLEKQTTLAGLEKEMRAHPDSALLAQFIAAHKELDTYL